MTGFSYPLSSLDAFRFAAYKDTRQALAEMGLTSRQEIADRLGTHIDFVPDMEHMVGPLYVEITCSGVANFMPEHPWLPVGPCQEAAARISVMGCVHEHIIPAPLCRTHITCSLRSDTMWCGFCEDAGEAVPMVEMMLDRREHVDAFLLGLLMAGVTATDQDERQRIEEFVTENLDAIVAPHLREPLP